MKINHVNYGIGNVIKGEIYINKHLKKYPDLYNQVLQHEIKHTKGENPDIKEVPKLKLIWFMILHPKSWVQLSPIWYMHNTILIDKTISIFWILGITVAFFVFIAKLNPSIALYLIGLLFIIAGVLIKWGIK